MKGKLERNTDLTPRTKVRMMLKNETLENDNSVKKGNLYLRKLKIANYQIASRNLKQAK